MAGAWGDVATYLRRVDPYHRIATSHAGSGHEAPLVVDFDMVGGHHDASVAVLPRALGAFHEAYAGRSPVPVLCGETAYEGHMQQAWQDVQRQMFWMFMLSGAAGHTYGAAGVWHASVEGDPGCASSAFGGRKVYDWTTWREGMNYPGSTQLGLGRQLFEEYPWHRFEPHPEWAENDCYAAGIPREVRFIYQPKRGIYNWQGTVVKAVETDLSYRAFYVDPATGRRFDQGRVTLVSSDLGTFEGHTRPRLYEDDFERDSPHFKCIFIHDRRDGEWGAMLGRVDTPDTGSEIRLAAAAIGDHAALLMSDGNQTWRTPPVKVTNTTSGKTGLWLFQIGEQQAFGKFEVSPMVMVAGRGAGTGQFLAPDLPSPQDWLLVIERDRDRR